MRVALPLVDLENAIQLYEAQSYGTDSVANKLSSRLHIKAGSGDVLRTVEQSPFLRSKRIISLESLNAFNSVFRVKTERDIYIAKILSDDEVDVNNFLRHVGAKVSADLLSIDRDHVAFFSTCSDYLTERDIRDNNIDLRAKFAAVAQLLADIHSIKPTGSVQPSRPKVPIGRFSDISIEDYFQLPGFEIQKHVEAAQVLSVSLNYVNRVPKTCFIHGDFKFDNVMSNESRPLAIDWEAGGLGHKEADLGILIGSLISLWLREKAQAYDGDISNILSAGRISSNACMRHIACILDSYSAASNSRVNIRLIALYIGNFLLDRGLVTNALGGRFNLETTLCFRLGQSIIATPMKFARAFKGLAQNELTIRPNGCDDLDMQSAGRDTGGASGPYFEDSRKPNITAAKVY